MSDRFNQQGGQNPHNQDQEAQNHLPDTNAHPQAVFENPDPTNTEMSQNVSQCPGFSKNSPVPHIITINEQIDDQDGGDGVEEDDEIEEDERHPAALPHYEPACEDNPDGESLSPRQQQAIHLIINGLSDAAVAAALGLSRRTIYRWKWHDPFFRNSLDEAQRRAWDDAKGILTSAMLQSAQKLNKIVRKGTPEQAIKAAKAILSTQVLKRLL